MVPRDGSTTRDRILAAAERLVIDNGFSATSVEAVIAESKTSKGAFFHHFGSKIDLAEAMVGRYVDADLRHLDRALEVARTAAEDPVERVVAFLRVFEDEADELMDEQSSCLYAAVLAERQLIDTGTSARITTAVEHWRAGFAGLIEDAQRGVEQVVDPAALADHVFVTFEGAFLLCRTTGDPGHMRRQLRVLRQLIQCLLGIDPAQDTSSTA